MRIKLHRGHCAGFTLLELIISSALMSVVLISAYLCLSAGFSTKKLVEPRLETLQNARVALALITADLRCACVLTQEFEFLGEQRKAGSIQADNLDFATHNYTPGKPREGDYCQVSYFLDKNMETGQFSLWRRRNPRIAPDALAGGRREEIARNVRGLQFEYYDGFEWFDNWGDPKGHRKEKNAEKASAALDPGNLSGLPEAVRITLMLDANPPRLRGEARKSLAAGTGQAVDNSSTVNTNEPPLVFQTVARLNLAAAARKGGSAGDAQDSGAQPSTQNNATPFFQ